MNREKQSVAPVAMAVICGSGLTLLAYRGAPLLTFDGYYYCELAKQFTTEWPDRFGNHWPFGYPLLGALVARCGVSAFHALCIVSLYAFIVLNRVAWSSSSVPPKQRTVGLIALSSAPVVAVQLGGILTELPFATAVLALAGSFSQWPKRSAIVMSATLVVVSLCIRYAGVLTLGIMAVWITVCIPTLIRKKKLGFALLAWGGAATCVGLLLGWNILKSGHASGAERGEPLGFWAIGAQLSEIGWSLPSALLAGGARDAINPGSMLGRSAGLTMILGICCVCSYAWIRPTSGFSRPLALLSVGYLVGMAGLRCIGSFDALFSARTFLPVLFPLGLLLFERLQAHPLLTTALSFVLLSSGVVAAVRGVSREITGDVRPAVDALKLRLRPEDRIAINDHAFTVSAYFPVRTVRAWPTQNGFDASARFLVVAGEPMNRAGAMAPLSTAWRAALSRGEQSGAYKLLLDHPSLVVLEAQHLPSP